MTKGQFYQRRRLLGLKRMDINDEVKRSSHVAFVSQSERKNARYQRYMEDTHMIIPCLNDNTDIFYASVFDGHGGKETATFASNHLHNNLIDAWSSNKLDSMEQCLEYAYTYTDIESSKEDMKNSGSTGVTVLIVNEDGKRVVYSANAGDSRSILYSDKKTIRLSFDHKATDENEAKRITELGGFVMNKRVIGILAVSRSLGDHSCKRYVTAKPFINRVELTDDSEFIVLACDGVYDVLNDDDVSSIVKEEIKKGNVETCAEKIVQQAIEFGSTDNITAVVVGLKPISEWSDFIVCCIQFFCH